MRCFDLLVGPCSLEYSKIKIPDHYWTDPTASELIQRHRIHSSARQHGLLLRGGSPQRPALRVSSLSLFDILSLLFYLRWKAAQQTFITDTYTEHINVHQQCEINIKHTPRMIDRYVSLCTLFCWCHSPWMDHTQPSLRLRLGLPLASWHRLFALSECFLG